MAAAVESHNWLRNLEEKPHGVVLISKTDATRRAERVVLLALKSKNYYVDNDHNELFTSKILSD